MARNFLHARARAHNLYPRSDCTIFFFSFFPSRHEGTEGGGALIRQLGEIAEHACEYTWSSLGRIILVGSLKKKESREESRIISWYGILFSCLFENCARIVRVIN